MSFWAFFQTGALRIRVGFLKKAPLRDTIRTTYLFRDFYQDITLRVQVPNNHILS